MESEVITTDIKVIAADTEVIATDTKVIAIDTNQKREQRESAYVSRKRMWRTLPEPSSVSGHMVKQVKKWNKR